MITLQEISNYLPYKLNVKLVKQNRNYKVNNIYLLSLQLLHDNYKNSNDEIYIPILRPLSDLTKEIEVNGKKFIPSRKIMKYLNYFPEEGTEFDQYDYMQFIYNFNNNYRYNFWKCIDIQQMLLSWHFWLGDQDRFGKDIIDLNTLK